MLCSQFSGYLAETGYLRGSRISGNGYELYGSFNFLIDIEDYAICREKSLGKGLQVFIVLLHLYFDISSLEHSLIRKIYIKYINSN